MAAFDYGSSYKFGSGAGHGYASSVLSSSVMGGSLGRARRYGQHGDDASAIPWLQRLNARARNGFQRFVFDVLDNASVHWVTVMILWFFHLMNILLVALPPAENLPWVDSAFLRVMYSVWWRVALMVAPPGAVHHGAGGARVPHYDDSSLFVATWILGLVWILMVIAGMVMHANDDDFKGHRRVAWRSRIFHDYTMVMNQYLAFPTMVNLLSIFSCRGQYWQEDASMPCYAGTHSVWVGLSAALLPCLVFLQIFSSATAVTRHNGVDKRTGFAALGAPSVFKQGSMKDALAASHGRADVIMVGVRFVLACIYAFGAETMPPWAYIVCTGALFAAWFVLYYYLLPYHMMLMNQMQCALAAVAMAGVVGMGVAQGLHDQDLHVEGSAAVFWFVAVVGGIAAIVSVHLRSLSLIHVHGDVSSPYMLDAHTRCAISFMGTNSSLVAISTEHTPLAAGGSLDSIGIDVRSTGAASHAIRNVNVLSDVDASSAGAGGAGTWKQLDALYSEAALRLSTSATFHLFYAHYLGRHRGNRHMERLHLRQALAQMDSLAFDIRFFVWNRFEEMAREDEAAGKSHMTVAKRVQYEALLDLSRKQVRTARELVLSWWTTLCDRTPDMAHLEATGQRITRLSDATTACFEELLSLAPQSAAVMRGYAEFLMDVMNDTAHANELLVAAEQIEDEQSRAHANAGLEDITAFMMLPETDLSGESLGLLEISLQPGSIGSIVSANLAALRVLGYIKRELLGREYSTIVADPINIMVQHMIHDFVMNGNANTGTSTAARATLMCHHSGHIFPARIDSRPEDETMWLAVEELPTQQGFILFTGPRTGWRITGVCKRSSFALGIDVQAVMARRVGMDQLLQHITEVVEQMEASQEPTLLSFALLGPKGAGQGGCAHVRARLQRLPLAHPSGGAFLLRWDSIMSAKAFAPAATEPASGFLAATTPKQVLTTTDAGSAARRPSLVLASPGRAASPFHAQMQQIPAASPANGGAASKLVRFEVAAPTSKTPAAARASLSVAPCSASDGIGSGSVLPGTPLEASKEDVGGFQICGPPAVAVPIPAGLPEPMAHPGKDTECPPVRLSSTFADPQLVAGHESTDSSTTGEHHAASMRGTPKAGAALSGHISKHALLDSESQSDGEDERSVTLPRDVSSQASERFSSAADAELIPSSALRSTDATDLIFVPPGSSHKLGMMVVTPGVDSGRANTEDAPHSVPQARGPLAAVRSGSVHSGEDKSVVSGSSVTHFLRNSLRSGGGFERSLKMLQRAVIATFVVVGLMNIISTAVMLQLFTELGNNLQTVRDAGDRVIMVTRIVSATQQSSYHTVGIMPMADGGNFTKRVMNDAIDSFHDLHLKLYSRVDGRLAAERDLYTVPTIRLDEPDWSSASFFGPTRWVSRYVNLMNAGMEFEMRARRVALIPFNGLNLFTEDPYWMITVAMGEFLTAMNRTVFLADERSAQQMDTVRLADNVSLGISIGLFSLMSLAVVVPAVFGVLREKQQVFELYMDVPMPVVRALRARAAKRVEQQRREDDDGNDLALSPNEGDARARGQGDDDGEDTASARDLLDDDDRLQMVLQAMRARQQQNNASTAVKTPVRGTIDAVVADDELAVARRPFKRGRSTKIRLVSLMLMPCLLYILYFISMFFYHIDMTTFARHARKEVLWGKQLEITVFLVNFNLRYAASFCFPGFTEIFVNETQKSARAVESLQDALLYGNQNLDVRGMLSTSSELSHLYLEDGCVPNGGYYYQMDECRSQFYNGIVGRGLLGAFKEYLRLADMVSSGMLIAMQNLSSCQPTVLSTGNPGLLHNLAERMMVPGFGYVTSTLYGTADSRLRGFERASIVITFFSILALFLFYFGIYRRTVRTLDRDIKQARRLLLLLPDEVARMIPSISKLARKLSSGNGAASDK